jgi:glucokinase
MILAGDVGGTNTRLGLFRTRGGRLETVRERTFPSQEFASLERIVDAFLGGEKIRACTVGVAGPVSEGASQVVNLRWPVEAKRLARRTGADCAVINDLEATAWGLPLLAGRQSVSLTPGLRPRAGNAALIAAGTGLGMAILSWDGARHRPSASEGGHQSFAPRDALEIALLRWLRRRHGRVSIERAVSGPGIGAIYRFLVGTGRARRTERMRRLLDGAEDPNAAITQAGLAREDRAAARTLDRFVSLYGAAAGDLALVAKAVGGVWVGGGIAPRILPRLREGGFVRAFRDKGRLTPLVAEIPVRVILEPRTALLGAAAFAARRGR